MAKQIRLRVKLRWVEANDRWHVKSRPSGYHLCELYDCEGMVEAWVPKFGLDKKKVHHLKITVIKEGEEDD